MWTIEFHDDFDLEFDALAEAVQDELLAQLKLLEKIVPTLGRPRVDTLNGSVHANMKELRFAAESGEWRAAFAFDPRRRAIVLVAGDKSGGSEKRFYKQLIAKADKRFTTHCERLEQEEKQPQARQGTQEEIAMGKTLKDRLDKLPAARRSKIEARADELFAEEMSLKDLRKARQMTQQHMAELLGIGQDGISRIEQRSDLLISTLRNYVARMGGELELVARFPDRPPVLLQDLAELSPRRPRASKKKPTRTRPRHVPA